MLMSLPSEAAMLLQGLGNTAEEVALRLGLMGIQGVRNTVRILNPIVRYIQTNVADAWNINVIAGDMLSMNFRDGRKEEVALPNAIRQFLDAFNRGTYPELELPPEKN
jgi:hypothetical protein